MKLSLIIPNYNNNKYLKDCLESVINQSYKPYEVLIADDASTDSSVEIIKKYESKYAFIKGIYNKKNMGVAYNRHNAIIQSKGNYITTIDSDDFFYNKNKLKKEMDLIKKYKFKYNKDIIAYSNIVIYKKNEIKRKFNKKNIVEGDLILPIITRNKPNPLDFIVKKSKYLSSGGYNINIPLYEDWDLNIRLSLENEFYYTGIDGTAYRQHNEGLSSANYQEHYKWLKRVFHKNVKKLDIDKKIYAYTIFYKYLFKYRSINELKKELKKYPRVYSFIKNNYKKIKGEFYEG